MSSRHKGFKVLPSRPSRDLKTQCCCTLKAWTYMDCFWSAPLCSTEKPLSASIWSDAPYAVTSRYRGAEREEVQVGFLAALWFWCQGG
ncbi:hypothetical protein EYF80_030842 [Liparis tanakae]|uniref:Uncharacterized protein n=1 Tax=Liparis tanakae TaxID=230148 RepID=A0A4Z2GZL2_9TELE|nr:hypothetical protein EYF80_030842 [Liparis tanakae]